LAVDTGRPVGQIWTSPGGPVTDSRRAGTPRTRRRQHAGDPTSVTGWRVPCPVAPWAERRWPPDDVASSVRRSSWPRLA